MLSFKSSRNYDGRELDIWRPLSPSPDPHPTQLCVQFSLILQDFQGSWRPDVVASHEGGLVAPTPTFARFQAGFLASEDFHRISYMFIDVHAFPGWIVTDFHGFAWIVG